MTQVDRDLGREDDEVMYRLAMRYLLQPEQYRKLLVLNRLGREPIEKTLQDAVDIAIQRYQGILKAETAKREGRGGEQKMSKLTKAQQARNAGRRWAEEVTDFPDEHSEFAVGFWRAITAAIKARDLCPECKEAKDEEVEKMDAGFYDEKVCAKCRLALSCRGECPSNEFLPEAPKAGDD